MLSDFPEITPVSMDFFRSTTQTNDYNEKETVWSDTPNESVDVILRPLSGNSRYVSNMHGYDADFKGYVDGTPDIRQGDRAVDSDGNRYEVQYADSPMRLSEYTEIHLKWVSNDGNNTEPPEGS